ncbi:MAG: photosynthetic reaction center subunit H [Polyangiaceae bacterium]|jgi:photosynthetic reaction center H subunit|nr:photosynthetic reaction center subunit H [Polyangiaceae bacterium]
MSTALTESLDVAQVVLYAFWAFFFGLIFWLRREDRREGYPLESDNPRKIATIGRILIPAPKTFLLPGGGEVRVPNFVRDVRPIAGARTAAAGGATLEPTGDPLISGVGPASFAARSDAPELTHEGHDLVAPMRVLPDFAVCAGPDPRGWPVVATDGKVAGTVKEIWVDRADAMARYLEVELPAEAGAAETRLLPVAMMRLLGEARHVKVTAVRAEQFARVPRTKEPDRVTLAEEDQIGAFYAGGRLYAEPKRLGPVL